MKRTLYMTELKRYLSQLSREDYEGALDYFNEYFDEAGPDNEAEAIAELGTPKEAAQLILKDLGITPRQGLLGINPVIWFCVGAVVLSFVGLILTDGDILGIILGSGFAFVAFVVTAHRRRLTHPVNLDHLDEKSLRQQRLINYLFLLILAIWAAPFALILLGIIIGIIAGTFLTIAGLLFAGWASVLAALIGAGFLGWYSSTLFAQSTAAGLLVAGGAILLLSLTLMACLVLTFIGKWCWRTCVKIFKKLKSRGKHHETAL